MLRPILHYSMHFVFPLGIAMLFFRKNWKVAYLLMLCTMLIDLDHLLAKPIFDPNRCSIGFHILHSYYAIALYFVLLLPKKTRIIAVGLLFHIFTDWVDCLLMNW